jgi:cytochrome b involved in lipid metabolism
MKYLYPALLAAALIIVGSAAYAKYGQSAQVPVEPAPEEKVSEQEMPAEKPSVLETKAPAPTPTQEPGTFTAAQVALHNSAASCYTIVRGSVYDLTEWIGRHPGGKSAILRMCGKDATQDFEGQHGGQRRPESELAGFEIGVLIN